MARRTLVDWLIHRYQPRPLAGYAPPPAALAPGLWVLERRLRMPGGPRLPTRTTVVRLTSGGLLVVAPPAVEVGGSTRSTRSVVSTRCWCRTASTT